MKQVSDKRRRRAERGPERTEPEFSAEPFADFARRRHEAYLMSGAYDTAPLARPDGGWAGQALARWMGWVFRHPGPVLAALIMLLVAAIVAATLRLSVDTDSSKMLSADLPFQQRAQAVRAAFPAVKNTIAVVVRAPTSDAADAALEALVERFRRRDDAFESVFAPSADPFFLKNGFLYGDLETVEKRLSALSSASNLIARLRTAQTAEGFLSVLAEARALAEKGGADAEALDPFYRETAAVFAAHAQGERRAFGWTGALDPSRQPAQVARVITLQPKLDFTRLNPAKAALAATAEEIAALPAELSSAVEIGVTGDPALRADELASVTANLALSLGLSLLFVAGILRLACGSNERALLALGALLATLVLTGGAAAILATPLNLVSIAFVVLMVGLGIDYAIHILLHIEEDARENDEDPFSAVKNSGRALGTPLALSAATTAIAFLAFTTTDFVGMAQLGLIGGVGVLIAFAVAATLIPAIVALRPSLSTGELMPPLRTPRRRRMRFWDASITAAIGFASLLAAPSVRFDADPMSLRDPDSASVQTYGWLAESRERGPFRVSVLAESPEEAEAVAARLREAPTVRSAIWLGDLTPKEQDEKLDLLDIAYPSIEHAVSGEPTVFAETGLSSPRDVAGALSAGEGPEGALKTALLAYAASDRADPAALREDLFRHFSAFQKRIALLLEAGPVALEDLPAPLVARYKSEAGVYRVEAAPIDDLRQGDALERFTTAVREAEPRAAGGPLQIAGAADTVSMSIAQATLLSLGAAALLAWGTVKRLSLVAAIVAPLALAASITAAASVVLETPFNYANVIVLPLMIGIGVDSGVHLALRGVAVGTHKSVFSTSTPRAVVFSALTTVAAFGTLALSDHQGTSSMGALLAIGLGAALFSVLSVTPVLIRWAERGRGQRKPG